MELYRIPFPDYFIFIFPRSRVRFIVNDHRVPRPG